MTATNDRPTIAATPARAIRGVRLLQADPELGHRLTVEQMTEARRHAILATVALDPGHWGLDRLRDDDAVSGEVHGFLMLSGVLLSEVSIAGHASVRLITPGEVVLLDELETVALPASWEMVVLANARLAVLDDRLLVIARRWPRLLSALLKRGGRHNQHGLLQQAISQLPRVEDRLLALLWSIADHQGVVRPDGVWVPMALPHDTLAQMVGARRPTITLALRSLTEHGVMRAEKDGWLLTHDSVQLLSPNNDEPVAGGTRCRT